jgi:hypothetical protein
MNFYVWAPYDGDPPDEPNVTGLAATEGAPRFAAEQWVKTNHADLDYPREILVRLEDEDGHRYEFLVRAEQTIVFRAETPVGPCTAPPWTVP